MDNPVTPSRLFLTTEDIAAASMEVEGDPRLLVQTRQGITSNPGLLEFFQKTRPGMLDEVGVYFERAFLTLCYCLATRTPDRLLLIVTPAVAAQYWKDYLPLGSSRSRQQLEDHIAGSNPAIAHFISSWMNKHPAKKDAGAHRLIFRTGLLHLYGLLSYAADGFRLKAA